MPVINPAEHLTVEVPEESWIYLHRKKGIKVREERVAAQVMCVKCCGTGNVHTGRVGEHVGWWEGGEGRNMDTPSEFWTRQFLAVQTT